MNIPIVVAFTANYFIPAATTILSILNSGQRNERFHFVVLNNEDLPDRMQQKLIRLGGDNTIFTFLNLKGKLKDTYIDERYTEAASYRLLLPELLPDYDKVIYIDCDIIVRNDIAKLYRETELNNNYLAGVFEAPLDFQVERFKSIGCNPREYINSGFLIMNLALLRQDGMTGKLIEALKVDYLEFPDQDVLNKVCQGRIMGLPPYHNSIRTYFIPQYRKFFLEQYTESELAEVVNHGTIHYTGGKPWNQFTVEFLTWWRQYEQLPSYIKEEWEVNHKIFTFFKIYNTTLGEAIINKILTIYRKIKHGKKH